MCKLLGHVVKLIASASLARRSGSGSGSRDEGGGAGSRRAGGSLRERASSVLARSSSSRVRRDDAPPESGIPGDRVDVERRLQKRRTTSLTEDREKDEKSQSLPSNEEDRPRHDEDRKEDRQGEVHSPTREGVDVAPTVPPSASLRHRFEAQSRELSILQHECRAVLEEKKALTDAYAALRMQYDERGKKLSVARHERQAAVEQRKEVDDMYMALKDQFDEQTTNLDAVRCEHQTALEQKQKVEEECATLRQRHEAQKNEHGALNNKYQSLKAVLEQRTSELQGVQRFLTIEDTSSGTEVVNSLRKLNEEVRQSTAFMTEWAVENFMFETPATHETTVQSGEQTRTSETLGTRFMQLLGTKKHKDNPVLLEMALRAYLVYELYWVASPWSIGQEEQSHNLYVDAIYQRIRETEGPAVSGNWRAIARAYTLPACISDPEVAHTFDATIISGFSDILAAAGCTATKSEVTSALWLEFGDKVHHFVSLAGQVNKLIGVGVISEDFEVLVIWPDVVFDERAMEDAYDNGDRVKETEEHEQIVLCATELGLMQRLRVGAGSAQKGKPSELIVVKPKVALVSVIDIIE